MEELVRLLRAEAQGPGLSLLSVCMEPRSELTKQGSMPEPDLNFMVYRGWDGSCYTI